MIYQPQKFESLCATFNEIAVSNRQAYTAEEIRDGVIRSMETEYLHPRIMDILKSGVKSGYFRHAENRDGLNLLGKPIIRTSEGFYTEQRKTLLEKYGEGSIVAILGDDVIANSPPGRNSEIDLLKDIYGKIGVIPIYITTIRKTEPVNIIPTHLAADMELPSIEEFERQQKELI